MIEITATEKTHASKPYREVATARVIEAIKGRVDGATFHLDFDNGLACPNVGYKRGERCLAFLTKLPTGHFQTFNSYYGKFTVTNGSVLNWEFEADRTLDLVRNEIRKYSVPPAIPRTNEVLRYEREQPVFQSKTVVRDRGDALLSALDGGQQIQERRIPPGVVCALPVPARHWLSITLTNGSVYRIGVSFEGGLVYLPEGRYEVRDRARERVAKVMSQLGDDLRQEIVSTPKPLLYTVSMINDGGTLSGIARLFYGDAAKWREIYEVNRSLIKNPNVIDSGMRLTIPKLQ